MNRHSAAGNDEANCESHHELVEEIAQLKERERVLVSENGQLRAQLVEMKEEAHRKYDDLMVQYNMKREYEDDDTSNNQVTVKTEWDDEDVKQEIKVEIKEEEEGHGIVIKREYVTEMQQQIKQELSDEATTNEQSNGDGDIVKDEYFSDCDVSDCVEPEIKDEFDYGQEVEIKQEEDEEEEDTTDNEEMVDIKEEEEDDGETQIDDFEVWTQDYQSGDETRSMENASMDTTAAHPIGQSHNVQNASNENESIEEGCANLASDGHNFANQSNDSTVTQSDDLLSPSTSTGLGSNRTALNQQTTASTGRNATKRKQPTSKRSAKRSKKTIEEDGEDISIEDRGEAKVIVFYLNCTQSNCNVKLDSMDHLNVHLSTVHRIAPLRCFAQNCDARFDNQRQFGDHLKLSHPQDTRFVCAVCPKEFDSQHNAYVHWYQNHLNGQFQCNFVSDCTELTDTRGKMTTHQKAKHYSQLKHFHCTHPGCTSSFSCNSHLKQHQLTHLATNQFHCNWPHCSKQCKVRSNLVMHIRMQHFGLPKLMKDQKAKNIVDLRDPNEYVRVVVDE